jgi:hypothetical protein
MILAACKKMIESHFRNLQYQGSSPFQKGVLMEEMGHLGCIGSLFAGDNSGPDHPKKKQKKKKQFRSQTPCRWANKPVRSLPGIRTRNLLINTVAWL